MDEAKVAEAVRIVRERMLPWFGCPMTWRAALETVLAALVQGEQALAEAEARHLMPCAESERLRDWVTDLQSGMWVNCVYCGHRYGPGETTPVSMADALKAHIEACPDHPMSALKAALAEARAEVDLRQGELGSKVDSPAQPEEKP